MKNSAQFCFPVVSFRHVESPFKDLRLRNYYAIVDTRHLPDLTGWRKINVRDPKLTGAIPKEIRQSFRDNHQMFVFMNRGIVIAAESVHFDNKASTATVTLHDPDLHGLLDGGHTYNIIMEETAGLEGSQYVKIEILEGFDSRDSIAQIVDARNTSNQVRDQSLMNLKGQFDKLKNSLTGQPYLEDIAFKEYDLGIDGNPKSIDVREIIAALTVFDADNFSETAHPIIAYSSKAACLKHYEKHPKTYDKLYPLAANILELYDEIQLQLPELYNTARKKISGKVKGGFGKLTGVSTKGGYLNFLQEDAKYGVPSGLFFPILGAFRALIEEKGGRFVWGKNLDPVKLLNGNLGVILADTIGEFARTDQNPSKTGKSQSVWRSCFQSVQVEYLKA
ncbi:MAG: AIPR family protein [Candidatus Sumerlaeaceae bacterium]|nr:AIPR family protein [Candidatus Sumerlaeaceae bacterium]